jgi:ParB-like chromosome segregation protein Spo0J
MTRGEEGEVSGVKLAFERDAVILSLDQIIPLKTMRPGTKEGKKYAQIVSSVGTIGFVEAPVVTRDQKRSGAYFLLDGHLRIEVLRDLGINEVEWLVSTDGRGLRQYARSGRHAPPPA